MNYFGHLFIADDNDASRIGHYLGDFIKGRPEELKAKYLAEIANGIIAHRRLDVYTDSHPAVIRAVGLMKPHTGKYSNIIIDVLFDYYLIKHWNKFAEDELDAFKRKCYHSLRLVEANPLFSAKCRDFTGRLIRNDAFGIYATLDGIGSILCGIDRRLSRPSPLPQALEHIRQHYAELEASFLNFMPDVLALVRGTEAASMPTISCV